MNINPLPKDMTTETPLTDKKWIWGTGMDGSPIEVVSAEFARRLEMDRARLIERLSDLSGLVSRYPDYFKAHEANMGVYLENARALLAELERNEK
jgi:hypothetical protein